MITLLPHALTGDARRDAEAADHSLALREVQLFAEWTLADHSLFDTDLSRWLTPDNSDTTRLLPAGKDGASVTERIASALGNDVVALNRLPQVSISEWSAPSARREPRVDDASDSRSMNLNAKANVATSNDNVQSK